MDAIADRDEHGRGAVRAAGGLVARDGRVLLVHRPRFDDWSLPKGKLKRGEHPLVGAVREVREETGVVGVPGIRLPSARYDVWSGDALVEKLVDYWAMAVGEIDEFSPDDEVDDLAWLGIAEASGLLSYPRDVRVLAAFRELPPMQPPVVLVRAVEGPAEAAHLATLLALWRPGRLVTADLGLSLVTLAPLAAALGMEIDLDESLDGDAPADIAATALRTLADAGSVTVVCGGPEVFAALPVLGGAGLSLSQEARGMQAVGPGDGVVLSFSGGRLFAIDHFSAQSGEQ